MEDEDVLATATTIAPELLSYGTYLRLDDLLAAQAPLTQEHDELLFVIIHQVYELWFKQILHEAARLQERLEAGDEAGALHTARRIAKILKTIVGQLDVLETMTPRQFAAFRPELGTASGFQSHQFRVIEAVFGRRDFADTSDPQLALSGHDIPATVFERDPRQAWRSDPDIAAVLLGVYRDETTAAEEVCEALVDIDEGIQEWRYRHVKMVERIIGGKVGTGGSSGAAYLRTTLFRPAFPDLWEVRSRV
jgi:tryptophan 2,3-dioxygenase